MKRDIESRDDLVQLLEAFYTKAFADELIGHFFTKVVPLNLEVHIPVIADFWEAIIFNKHTYKKNVMVVHQHIHHLSHIKKNIWIVGCRSLQVQWTECLKVTKQL
jgi:hemoglobin